MATIVSQNNNGNGPSPPNPPTLPSFPTKIHTSASHTTVSKTSSSSTLFANQAISPQASGTGFGPLPSPKTNHQRDLSTSPSPSPSPSLSPSSNSPYEPGHIDIERDTCKGDGDFGLEHSGSVEMPQDLPSHLSSPDGGYGWVCVACVFLVNACTWGLISVRLSIKYFFHLFLLMSLTPMTTNPKCYRKPRS